MLRRGVGRTLLAQLLLGDFQEHFQPGRPRVANFPLE